MSGHSEKKKYSDGKSLIKKKRVESLKKSCLLLLRDIWMDI